MAGITLAQAQAKLDLWMEAEGALATSQEYEITVDGSKRVLRRADLPAVAERITYWNRIVQSLDRAASGRGRARYVVN